MGFDQMVNGVFARPNGDCSLGLKAIETKLLSAWKEDSIVHLSA